MATLAFIGCSPVTRGVLQGRYAPKTVDSRGVKGEGDASLLSSSAVS